MYYTKLEKIYIESNCLSEFSEDLLLSFDSYLQTIVLQNETFISPYEFAVINKMSLEQSIKFFLYFVDDTDSEKGVLSTSLFFECTTNNCFERIFLDESQVDEFEYLCSECNKIYAYEDIKSIIKVYFQINEETLKDNEQFDKNSTMDILERMPDNLKEKSPSSSANQPVFDRCDEGAINLELVHSINSNQNNDVVSADFNELYSQFSHNYSDFLKG